MKFVRATWLLLRDAVEGFIADGALSRAASIAYFTLFSIAPVLLVVVAITCIRPAGCRGRDRGPAQ